MITGDTAIIQGHAIRIISTQPIKAGHLFYETDATVEATGVDAFGKEWVICIDQSLNIYDLKESDPSVPTKTVKLWTIFNSPFRLGGDLTEPRGCEWPVAQDLDLGKGYKGYLVYTPSGNTLVIEATTGGIVGKDASAVRASIEASTNAIMDNQVEQARLTALGMRMMDAEQFWQAYEK